MTVTFAQLFTFLRRRRASPATDVWVGLAFVFVLYVGSLVAFNLAGEPDLADPWQCLWWLSVTLTTVGYGDLFPKTAAGQAWAIFVLWTGVAVAAYLLSQIAARAIEARARRMNGLGTYTLADHVVVLGHEPGFTEQVLREFADDEAWRDKKVVLIAPDLEQNPFPPTDGGPGVSFVRARLDSDEGAGRASLAHAAYVVVHGATDDETTAAALHAAFHAPNARIVVYAESERAHRTLTRALPHVSVVAPITAHAVCQELQDPGTYRFALDLLDHRGQGIYRVDVKHCAPGTTVGDLAADLRARYDALVVGVESGGVIAPNPPHAQAVTGGDALIVIASRRPVLG